MKKVIKKYYKDAIVFLIPFIFFFLLLLAYYPGIITYDGNFQWNQVQSKLISDAHPFFSTYFMYLVSKIWNSPRAILSFQIFIFSFFWTFICHKTRNNNFKRQVIYTCFISLIPIISIYSITLCKDILYSYYLMMLAFLTYYYINDKLYNTNRFQMILIGLLLFLIYSYRHNAIVIVILYLIIITFLFLKNNKKNIRKIFIIFITFLILFGVFSIPKKIYLERFAKETESKASEDSEVKLNIGTINRYMTWIFGAYIKEDKISKKDQIFLNNIMNIKHWKKAYDPYLINGTFNPDKLNEKYLLDHQDKYQSMFMKYTLKYPQILLDHYLIADSLLISIDSIDHGYIYIYPFRKWKTGHYGFGSMLESRFPKLEKKYTELINFTYEEPLKYLYQPGLILYISIAGVLYLRFSRKNKNYYLILLPMILNTISLLPVNLAQDLRYVYINYLTIIVIGLLLIAKKENRPQIINELKKQNNLATKRLKVLLIIPAYNEEKNILKTYQSIVNYNKKANLKYDVIVINDGSTDQTKDICLENNIPTIHLIHNLGIGGAVQTGYKYAYENNYDIAVQFDGDGQHNVKYIKNVIGPIIEDKADFVIGSRFLKKEYDNFRSTFVRRIGINIISFFIQLVAKQKIYDTTSGFRACNKDIIAEFSREYPLEYPEPITTVELIKKQYQVKEVPVKMNKREEGTSSIHSWKKIYYMVNVILSILIVGARRYK